MPILAHSAICGRSRLRLSSAGMKVAPVDERDSGWEDRRPRFRVYFFAGDGPGNVTWTYDVTDADVLDVLRWAQRQAGEDRMYAVALVRDDHPPHGGAPQRGLVWLVGMDANGDPHSEDERGRQRAMRHRRGKQLVLDDEP